MTVELLLDTGAFVALVDRSEKRHADCVAALEQWTGPIVTAEQWGADCPVSGWVIG